MSRRFRRRIEGDAAALTLLVTPAIYVAPRHDGETPKTQNKEMTTWFKTGRN